MLHFLCLRHKHWNEIWPTSTTCIACCPRARCPWRCNTAGEGRAPRSSLSWRETSSWRAEKNTPLKPSLSFHPLLCSANPDQVKSRGKTCQKRPPGLTRHETCSCHAADEPAPREAPLARWGRLRWGSVDADQAGVFTLFRVHLSTNVALILLLLLLFGGIYFNN